MKQVLLAFVGIISAALVVSPPARADFDSSQAWFSRLDDQTRLVLQIDLILTNRYQGLADGVFGSGTLKAIGAFQRAIGAVPDGVLTPDQMDRLRRDAASKYAELGIAEIKDTDSTLGIFLPTKLLTKRGTIGDLFGKMEKYASGRTYLSDDDGIGIALMKVDASQLDFSDLYAALSTPDDGSRPTYANISDDTFTLSGRDGVATYYDRFYRGSTGSVGYMLFWSDRYRTTGAMLATFTASMTYLLENDVATPPQAAPDVADTTDHPVYTGTGFFFATQGMIATNYHVAGECSSIDVAGYGHATLLKGDPDIDLAAIQLDSQESEHWANIRVAAPNLAESVLLLGYPLSSLLNSSLNVATGIVSAETGLGGNADWFTTNAGIQPGNSGGPILDANGNVIGMAVAKIDDSKLLKEADTTAPNIGFGIKDTALLRFLSIFTHTSNATVPAADAKTPQELAALGKGFTVQIICTPTAAKIAAVEAE